MSPIHSARSQRESGSTGSPRRNLIVRLLYLALLVGGVLLNASSVASLAPDSVPWATVWREAALTTLAWPAELNWDTGVPQVVLLALIAVGVAKPDRRWGATCGFVGVGGWLFLGVLATGLMVS
jgi:hypothetical protein